MFTSADSFYDGAKFSEITIIFFVNAALTLKWKLVIYKCLYIYAFFRIIETLSRYAPT